MKNRISNIFALKIPHAVTYGAGVFIGERSWALFFVGGAAWGFC